MIAMIVKESLPNGMGYKTDIPHQNPIEVTQENNQTSLQVYTGSELYVHYYDGLVDVLQAKINNKKKKKQRLSHTFRSSEA